jgi:hypothetical protein
MLKKNSDQEKPGDIAPVKINSNKVDGPILIDDAPKEEPPK